MGRAAATRTKATATATGGGDLAMTSTLGRRMISVRKI